MAKILYLTRYPAPYCERIHEIVGEYFKDEYLVVYCGDIEPDREWRFKLGNYNKIFLNNITLTLKNKNIHINNNIVKCLNENNPLVVISSDFAPTMLLAHLWCAVKGKKRLTSTDGTLQSEQHFSIMHRIIRKIAYIGIDGVIGAGIQSLALYQSYKVDPARMFLSRLCANNDFFKSYRNSQKKYEIMFSGQFIERKMPLFFAEIAVLIKNKLGYCKVLILGSGPLQNDLLSMLEKYDIDYDFPGYVQQHELPGYYGASKLLLFPTLNDPWGVVANEACAAGVPVVTCANAGVADDLIIHNYNGLILPLDAGLWADQIISLLSDEARYKVFCENASAKVEEYRYEDSAEGIIRAVEYVIGK